MIWKKLDALLSKAEAKGFKMANKAHVYVVNGILCLIAYNVYTVFRGYNEFFLEARQEAAPDLDDVTGEPQYPINKNIRKN
ncbi:unnamed protein product [Paramecium primaurelia]|uniref:Uncharacterized protein n=2 Tax=Paramecium TaxID=5884 RepID=A0A8S1W9R3_9CILI|nr:unnamed protein product [Paramecium primaurelia]CAD8186968.1 unnamed protein product [Paramecium pentaurelia]